MKTKIIAMIACLTLTIALITGCGSESSGSGSGEFTTVNDGVLTMGTNASFPPYEYYEGNEIVGIDVEIAGAVAEYLGLELEVQDMEFDAINTAVQQGKIDIGFAGMTVTAERQEVINFTTSYAKGVQSVIVPEGSPITSVDDLFADGANNVVGVQRNTTGDIYSTGDIEDKGLGTIDRYSKGADAVLALVQGKIDCVIIDNQPAIKYVEANDGLMILDTEYLEEDYAASISKDNEELLEAVNEALAALIEDGTIQAILDKYISAE